MKVKFTLSAFCIYEVPETHPFGNPWCGNKNDCNDEQLLIASIPKCISSSFKNGTNEKVHFMIMNYQ